MKTHVLSMFVCLIVLPPYGSAAKAHRLALPKEVADLPAAACSPDKPTVASGDSIKVRVWVKSPVSGMRYVWTATRGKVQGHDAEAVWSFEGVAPGVYDSTVTVTRPKSDRLVCSMQVIVREHTMGETQRVTRRDFLVKGQPEGPGYGLYSYLLLGSPPDESSRDRYRVAIATYLHQIKEIDKLEDEPSVDRSQLNITYLPVDMPPPPDVSADWALAHYDYGRASLMLAKLPETYLTGPYIVSVLKPIGVSDKILRPYLFQNLSTVPAVPDDLLSWWLRGFQSQAAQERFWDEKTGQQLALKLRTIVAVLAIAVPEVRQGLDKAIAWIH